MKMSISNTPSPFEQDGSPTDNSGNTAVLFHMPRNFVASYYKTSRDLSSFIMTSIPGCFMYAICLI
jgi:hypothetical protein